MDDDLRPSAIFRAEFLDRDLYEYEACLKHYESFGLAQIIAEVRFLLFGPASIIPFAFTGKRFYALMSWAIDYAADKRALDVATRVRLVDLCIDLVAVARRKTAPESLEALNAAILASVERVEGCSLYPVVGRLIADGVRGYGGEFEESPVGAFMEREGYPPD